MAHGFEQRQIRVSVGVGRREVEVVPELAHRRRLGRAREMRAANDAVRAERARERERTRAAQQRAVEVEERRAAQEMTDSCLTKPPGRSSSIRSAIAAISGVTSGWPASPDSRTRG